ncbi:hypothetical protein EYY60_07690 [Flavobacterium zhairuonense]|uniref:hypothetical protein n=1 Tax=Flavobacterium zhairuonense TaxID=2493631 RepID=UPI0010539139|nr:hypothetical protein [Flavobacterium zhairuonense]KAF2512122.1 hypothetical protein EYY60_07690 [Flavobacterium zhairuonense]
MKIKKSIFFAVCIVLMTVSSILAAPSSMPVPQQSGPPPPPPGPIDENLAVLMGCAILFGIYAIRRYNLTKKASM